METAPQYGSNNDTSGCLLGNHLNQQSNFPILICVIPIKPEKR